MAWLAPPPPFITSAATSVLLLLLAAGLAGTECSASLSMTAGTNHKRNALAKVTHAHKHKNSCKIQENHGDRPGGSSVAGYVCFFSRKTLKLMKKSSKAIEFVRPDHFLLEMAQNQLFRAPCQRRRAGAARQRMPLRLGFTASKCTSCKKAGERRAHTSDFHLQPASSQLTAVLVVNSGASVMTSALKQGHFAMLLPAGSFSEVHLSPPFLLLHKKSHFGAQHFIPRRMAREREDRAFFCLGCYAPPSKCAHVTRNEFQAQEIHQKQ
jgi:hypothetical protein